MRLVSLATTLLSVVSALPAQPQPLAPTSNITISTGSTLHYSSILIPAGVTVTFAGTAAAVVRCDGDCIVHGTLSVAGNLTTSNGPGAVSNGNGVSGSACSPCIPFGFCPCNGYSNPASPGTHYGVYGGSVPFSLMGGSEGGSLRLWSSPVGPGSCCSINAGYFYGGGGGGTLVVIAGGVIDVGGVINANGGRTGIYGRSGSAGSVLLRGLGGTTIRPTAQVLAAPEPGGTAANGGEVRIDAWGSAPLVQGTLAAPAPVVLTLPHLRATGVPTIGSTWSLDVYAPENSIVFVGAATQPAVSTPTPFGTLSIDLSQGGIIGTVATTNGHDPRATVPWVIPNQAQLIGLPLWLQGLAWPVTMSARLTNTITATVQ